MTSHIKQLVMLSLLNTAAVVSKVSSSLKTTRHEAFIFWYHIKKIHTQRSTSLLFTAKILSQPGIQLCVASVAVQSWQTAFHGLHERFPWLLQHSCLIWAQIILRFTRDEKIFQLHYGAVNQSPSQQMSKCLATGAIALCLHAIQQCGCKIILRERK